MNELPVISYLGSHPQRVLINSLQFRPQDLDDLHQLLQLGHKSIMVCHHLKIIKPKAYFSKGLSYSIELFYLEKVVGLLSDLFGDADFDGVELLAQPLLDHPARPLHLLGKVLPRRRGRQLKDGLERLRLREVERGVEEYPRDAGSRHRGLQIMGKRVI